MGHRFVGSLAAASVFLLAAVPASATPPANFSEQVVASGLSSPTAVAFLPDRRMLVTEKGGALKLVQNGTATTLTTLPVCTASEMGLLGIAPHPNFQSNGLVFLYRTKPAPGGCASATGRFNQVVTVQMSGDTVVPGSLTERLTGIRTDGGNHDGGTLRIGPDQKLYVSVGDTGIGDSGPPGASTNPYSQDRGALEGKILRLELDGITPAAGQPVHRSGGRAARGLRLRLAQSVPDELRPADRPPVGGRRRSEHDRGDRHHPVRRELRLAALRGHAAGRLPGERDARARHRSRVRVHALGRRWAGQLGHRRGVRDARASASSGASTSSATTPPPSCSSRRPTPRATTSAPRRSS